MNPTSYVVFLGLVAACGTDDRPETLAYITETILAPTCALAECHSAMTREFNYAFDNVALAQQALDGTDALRLIAPCDARPCSGDSYLIEVITDRDVYGNRMPYDSAMPEEDAQLIICQRRAASCWARMASIPQSRDRNGAGHRRRSTASSRCRAGSSSAVISAARVVSTTRA